MTQFFKGTSLISKFNKSNADFVTCYIRNSNNQTSKFGLTSRIIVVNQVKDKKVIYTKQVSNDKLFFNIDAKAINKPVFTEAFTKIVVECKPSEFNGHAYNKTSYYSVSQAEVDRFDLDVILEQSDASE